MNILLAVDQSRHSLAAVHWMEGLHLPAGSVVYLLDVVEIQQWPEWSAFDDARQFQKKVSTVWEKASTKARQLVNRLAAPFRLQGLETHPVVSEGIPGAEILTAIEQNKIDLVALGPKGLSGMKRFLLGSVSEWVLYDAPCSVLVVRDQPQSAAAANSRGLHVLLAMDGSSDSLEAVALLKTLKLPSTSRLTILHVVDKPTALITLALVSGHIDATKFAEDCRRTGQQAGEQLLEETRRDLMGEELEVYTKLTEGHAADEILNAAQEVQADLIVVGSSGVTELKRIMMLGGVSHKVVRHAPCSVLVVR